MGLGVLAKTSVKITEQPEASGRVSDQDPVLEISAWHNIKQAPQVFWFFVIRILINPKIRSSRD